MTLNVDINPYNDAYIIHESLLDLYRWKLSDIYKIDSILIEISDTHTQDIDLYVPKKHLLNQSISNYDNFLTLQTTQNIDKILEKINKEVTNKHFEYRVDDFSVNDLFLSLLNFVELILLSFCFMIFVVSSSNIGTIMPYFVGEFKDEITLLRILGVERKIIFNIFMLCCLCILCISLALSFVVAYLLSYLIAFFLKVKLRTMLSQSFILFLFQVGAGLVFSFRSIKKATEEVTYL